MGGVYARIFDQTRIAHHRVALDRQHGETAAFRFGVSRLARRSRRARDRGVHQGGQA